MKTKLALQGLSLALLSCLTSCVSPGDFDGGQIVSYQRTILNRSPQPRGGGRLGALQPAPGTTGPLLRVDTDKTGQSFIYLSLDEAVQRALANSVEVQVVSYDPAISREQAIEAAAQFDYILFGSTDYTKTNPATTTANPLNITKRTEYQAGIKQQNIYGGQGSLTGTLTRSYTNDGTNRPINDYDANLVAAIDQPLLRDFGPEVNLGRLRIAQLTYRSSQAAFRQKLEETINAVINDYWNLLQTRVIVDIQEELLRRTEETRDRIRLRVEIDATLVELKQAEAAVESRRAVLYRAQKNVGDAQDQLTRLINDAQINAITPYELIPTTPPAKIPVKIDPADQLALSLIYNPQLEQARLAISANQINVRIARNQTLPKLNLQASTTVDGNSFKPGQSDTAGQAVDSMWTFDNLGYDLKLVLEYPIGNRAAIAELRRQQFEVGKSVSQLQNLADQVAVNVRERIRQVDTTYLEMQANRLSVEASTAQLEALNAQERLRGKLTPEFLNVKLQAQQQLADSRAAELASIINYNNAMADLARITGTILRQYGIEMEKMPYVIKGRVWPIQQGNTPARPIDLQAPGGTAAYEMPLTTSKSAGDIGG